MTSVLSPDPAPPNSPVQPRSAISVGWKILLFMLLLAPALIMVMVLQTSPGVQLRPAINPEETRLIEQLIVDNSPPRISNIGDQILNFDVEELNLLAAFAGLNIPQLRDYTAGIAIHNSTAHITLTTAWPAKNLPFFLNLRLDVEQQDSQLVLRNLHAGRLPLPGFTVAALSHWLRREVEYLALDYQEVSQLQQSIKSITLQPESVDIHLQWEPSMLSNLRTQAQQLFIGAEERARILNYYSLIADISTQVPGATRTVSLQSFLPPLFEHAHLRSQQGSDPVAENRALLLALWLYVNYLPINHLVADLPADWSVRPRRLTVTLQRRNDLSQHFVTAAAIAATAGAGIAEVLANSKEDYDARYRSGFSFSDMTANVAGMALGETAARDISHAELLQQQLLAAAAESAYMPDIGNDNSGLSQQDFSAEFNDRNDPRYLGRLRDIDLQVDALPIYRAIGIDGVQ